MKYFLYTIAALFVFASCKTNRDYLSRSDEDRTVYDVVKRLNKKSSDEDAVKALPLLYPMAQQRHIKKANAYITYTELNKWNKILNEYSILQNMFEAIDNSSAASMLVTPKNYQQEISANRQLAAEDYYQQGLYYFSSSYREDLKKAYQLFKSADNWVNGYKDAKRKMDSAFNNSIVTVQINTVQDNSFFFNTGWGNSGYNYSNEYFQQNLIRDLGGKYANRYPAKFYTEWEARRDNVQPDWVVDLVLRNMDIPRPSLYNYARNVNKQIATGTDSTGKQTYQTVYAILNIQRQSFTARGQMDVNITDMHTRKNIGFNSYNDSFEWEEEKANYSGDSRALSSNDWALVNNNNFNMPRKEEILNQLYKRIYPQVKNKISYAVDW